MRILIFHNKYTQRGGEDTTVENEIESLRKQGHHVNLFLFDNGGSSLFQFLKFILYPFNLFSYFKVRTQIKKFKPDVIHIHNFFFTFSLISLWAIKTSKVPLIITVQNFRLICPSATLYYNGKLYLKGVKKGFTIRPALDKVYHNSFFLTLWLMVSNYIHLQAGTFNIPCKYIFVSNCSKEIFERSNFASFKSKFTVKYNFAKVEDEQLNLVRKEHFLFIGRLTEEKGIHTLLKTFENTSIQLIILGDGPLKREVEKRSAENPNILYLGFKAKVEVLAYLKSTKALIFPSVWYEGMPLSIIEAFSVGTPVIGSRIGAMKEMIIDDVNGLLFKPGDNNDLYDKVEKINALPPITMQELIFKTKSDFENRF